MSSMNRRQALVGGLTLVATGGTAVTATAAQPALAGLIAAHRAASAEVDAAGKIEAELDNALGDLPQILVPTVVFDDGEVRRGYIELYSSKDRDRVLRETAKAHREVEAEMTNSYCLRTYLPDVEQRVKAILRRSRRRVLRAINRGVREWEGREVEWNAAAERLQLAFDAEHDARLALIACRPRSEAEAATKSTYLRGFIDVDHGWLNADFLRGLIDELCRTP